MLSTRGSRGSTAVPARGAGRFLAAAFALAALLAGLGLEGCAARRAAPRSFGPAAGEQAARALAAWREAVARADALGPSRLLYDAKLKQGLASIPGTLALSTGEPVRATITGPFGSPVAVYENGALRGEKLAPVVIDPQPLLWLLAGVWKGPDPEVRGIDGDDALLVWSGPTRAEGVLNLPGARFQTLRVEHEGRTYEATYGGAVDPWPGKVTIEEPATSSRLQLTLQAREPLP